MFNASEMSKSLFFVFVCAVELDDLLLDSFLFGAIGLLFALVVSVWIVIK